MSPQRMHFLACLFNVDICGYVVLSKHYHLVLYVNVNENISNEEVCQRWSQLYSAPPLVARWMKQELTSHAEQDVVLEIINNCRNRLIDISWFMRCLNKFIANKEDKCKGRFYSLPSMTPPLGKLKLF